MTRRIRSELKRGLERGAVGVTTNPVLAGAAVKNNRQRWATAIGRAQAQAATPEQQAEALTRTGGSGAAESLLPVYEASRGVVRLGVRAGQPQHEPGIVPA